MEEETRTLKRGRDDGTEELIVDFNEDDLEEDGVFQLMLENKVLECEKKTAESEVGAWKQKFKELKTWVLKLDQDLVLKGGEFPWKLTGDSVEAEAWKQKCKELESLVLKLECEKKNAEAEAEAWKQKLECEEKNAEAEAEAEAWKQKFKELESWVLKLECEKKNAETEVEAWKQKFKEQESWVLKLECEKKNAEAEVEAWKKKFKELESWVLKLDKDKVLKGGEFPLKLTGDSVEASSRTQTSARIEPEEGLKVGVGMESSRSKEVAVNVIDLSTIYYSPGKGICHLQAAGTPPNVTLCEHRSGTKEEKRSGMEYGNVSRARKQLEFKEDRSPCEKMAPSTPGGGRPFSLSVIDISDSDDELTIVDNQKIFPTENQGSRKICISSDFVIGGLATNSFLKQAHTDNNDQEDVDNYNEELLAFSTPKRKRAFNVVTSDSESSDDNLPISLVKRMRLQERINDEVGSDVNGSLETATASVVDDVSVSSPKRLLVRLRKCGGRGRAQRNASQTSETKNDQGPNKAVEEDEPEEVGSESEGESLGGFIVNGSGVSESNDASSKSNSMSDDDVNFEEVLSTFQGNKDHNTKWEFEADMLAAFGKDPELCMKAVCALYRQQTADEQVSMASLCYNSRGFSKFDAFRGSDLAEFLTDGDPYGDLTKTVEELEEFDPKAIETCRTFATRYSKQLFEIYKNKEDPLFLPS